MATIDNPEKFQEQIKKIVFEDGSFISKPTFITENRKVYVVGDLYDYYGERLGHLDYPGFDDASNKRKSERKNNESVKDSKK
jgi:hypothetical protein